MRLRRYLLGLLIIAAVIFTVYLNFDRIALWTISRLYSLDISYKDMAKDHERGFVFEDIRILNKKMGVGVFSQRATIKPSRGTGIFKSVMLDFTFKDVHFLKGESEGKKTTYDTLSQLVAMPFEGRWMYKDVSGRVEIFSNGITVETFSANGREARVVVSGDLYYNNIVNIDVTTYFSKDALKEVPPELHSVIMRDEPNEWKSFSVKIKGNMKSPSMQVSGKFFRLNIGTAIMNN